MLRVVSDISPFIYVYVMNGHVILCVPFSGPPFYVFSKNSKISKSLKPLLDFVRAGFAVCK